MDRDAVLVAALGAAVLAGCTSSSRPSPNPSPSTPSPDVVDPDIDVLRTWYAEETTISQRWGGTLPLFGDHHREHAEEIAEHLRVRGEPPPSVSEQPAFRGSQPARQKALAKSERALAGRYQAALVNVRDTKVATLGGELAAAARLFAAVLTFEPRR